MKGFIQDLLIFALAVCCFIVGCQFEKKTHEPCPQVQYIKGKDSIVHDTVTLEKFVEHPKPSRTYAPQLTNIDKSDSAKYEPCDDSIRVYVTNKVDSSGSIQVNDSVQGKLLSTRITSQIQNVYIYKTDTLVKEKIVYKHGAIFGPYAKVRSGPEISFSIGGMYAKNKTGYIAGYDINTKAKAVEVGLFYNFGK